MIWPIIVVDAQPTISKSSSSDESYSLYSLSLEALHLLFIGCSIAETCFYVFVDGAKRAHSHQRAHIRHLHIKSNMFANISYGDLEFVDYYGENATLVEYATIHT